MRVFVSHLRTSATIELVRCLRDCGIEVDESPRSTFDSHGPAIRSDGRAIADPRWSTWYSSGLEAAVQWCDIFVAGLNERREGSTWMAIESGHAVRRERSDPSFRLCYWDPAGLYADRPLRLGFRDCPGHWHALPSSVDEAVAALQQLDVTRPGSSPPAA